MCDAERGADSGHVRRPSAQHVARQARIDFLRPRVDAAAQAADVFKAVAGVIYEYVVVG